MKETAKHFRLWRPGRWAGELLLVFVGVYAALAVQVKFAHDVEQAKIKLVK